MHKPKNQFVESRAIGVLEYPNDVFVFLEAGGERRYFQFEIDIQTTTNRIVLSNDGHSFFQTKESGLYKGFKSLAPIPIPEFPKNNPWIFLYGEILSHLRGEVAHIRGNLDANRRIFETIRNLTARKQTGRISKK